MSYSKSIRGDDNQQTEQLSHNRIIVQAGGAGVLFMAFLIILFGSMIIWLVINYGGLLALSLLSLWLVAVAGGIFLVGFFVYTRIGIMLSEHKRAINSERFLFAPEGSNSIYLHDLQPRFDVLEVSANIVAAGVPMMLPPAEEKKITADDETIIDMWKDGGMTLEAIEKALKPSGVTYYRVQKVVSEAKARGIVQRK